MGRTSNRPSTRWWSRSSVGSERHYRQTQVRLLLGGLVILVVVGGGLIWTFYGPGAALTALGCMSGAVGLFGLLWLILWVLGRFVDED
jgi:hypothetical protein